MQILYKKRHLPTSLALSRQPFITTHGREYEDYKQYSSSSTPTSFIPLNENIKKLVEVIGENQSSVKEMLVGMGLKDRHNFLEYTLSPAMKEGYVRMLYPDSPRHPRQRYLLTVKGLAVYKEIIR